MATYIPPWSIADDNLRHEIILEQCKACPVIGKPIRAWHAQVTVMSERSTYSSSYREEQSYEAYIVTCGVEAPAGFGTKKHLVAQVDNKWLLIAQDTIVRIDPHVDAVEVERIKTKIKEGV